MTFASPTEHVQFLATFLHVDFIIDPSIARREASSPVDAYYVHPIFDATGRTRDRHKIRLSHPVDAMDEAYSTALHELGHAATVMPWHYGVRQWVELELEELAWNWAKARALFWTDRMERDMRTGMESYYRHYGRGLRMEFPGWYPPCPDATVTGGLEYVYHLPNPPSFCYPLDSAGVFWDTLRELQRRRLGGS